MIKNIFDKFSALIILVIFSPILLILILIVYLNDFSNPLYISDRVGIKFINFKLYKIRSMIINADSSGVTSTSSNDQRITSVGRFIRKFKIDEIVQLFNVLRGDMSLVGPRPQIPTEVNLYTDFEKSLLNIKPGITDFSSIIFSDEAEILRDSEDPNKDYNLLIRPWKSRLGIFYIENNNFIIDLKLIFFTIVSILNREKALKYTSSLLKKLNAPKDLVEIAKREKSLYL